MLQMDYWSYGIGFLKHGSEIFNSQKDIASKIPDLDHIASCTVISIVAGNNHSQISIMTVWLTLLFSIFSITHFHTTAYEFVNVRHFVNMPTLRRLRTYRS